MFLRSKEKDRLCCTFCRLLIVQVIELNFNVTHHEKLSSGNRFDRLGG